MAAARRDNRVSSAGGRGDRGSCLRGLAQENGGARCLVGLQLDGGTRVCRPFEVSAVRPAFAAVLKELQRERSREEVVADRARGGRFAELPVAGRPLAEVLVRGELRERIDFHIRDVVYLVVDLRGVRGPEIRLEFKAKTLWRPDAEAEVLWWINAVQEMIGEAPVSFKIGEDGKSVALRAGWRVSNVEICSDFQGIGWDRRDVARLVTPARMRKGTYARTFGPGKERLETIEIGRRNDSNISICLYDKTRQIEAAKGGDASTYEAAWREGGWDGRRNVSRAELRLKNRGLHLFDPETGEDFGLRDPAALFDRKALQAAWAHATDVIRFVLPNRTRMERAEDDPRWTVVRGAAQCPPRRLQQAREIQEATHQEAIARTDRAIQQNLVRRAGLACLRVTDRAGLCSILQMVEATTPLTAPLYESGVTYARLREPFIGDEMRSEQDGTRARHGSLPGLEPIDFSSPPRSCPIPRASRDEGDAGNDTVSAPRAPFPHR